MRNITLLKGEARTIVSEENTAIAAGSGSLKVFGTPYMIALMEKATCEAIADELSEEETSVGTLINVNHTKASGIGKAIVASANLISNDGRHLVFEVCAKEEETGKVIGGGIIERFVVIKEGFMKRAEGK